MTDTTHCPLCKAIEVSLFYRGKRREYLRCSNCLLVFVPAKYHLSRAVEQEEYDKHENDVNNSGYRKFLSRLFVPLNERLEPAGKGLDFGCGPGPALATMLTEAGHTMSVYDPFYAPDRSVLADSYDFICATEVVEHLYHPAKELCMLWAMLDVGGYLGVMTKLVIDKESFSTWHYKNDATHVCFYSVATWQWWAREMGAQVSFIGADVILLKK